MVVQMHYNDWITEYWAAKQDYSSTKEHCKKTIWSTVSYYWPWDSYAPAFFWEKSPHLPQYQSPTLGLRGCISRDIETSYNVFGVWNQSSQTNFFSSLSLLGEIPTPLARSEFGRNLLTVHILFLNNFFTPCLHSVDSYCHLLGSYEATHYC